MFLHYLLLCRQSANIRAASIIKHKIVTVETERTHRCNLCFMWNTKPCGPRKRDENKTTAGEDIIGPGSRSAEEKRRKDFLEAFDKVHEGAQPAIDALDLDANWNALSPMDYYYRYTQRRGKSEGGSVFGRGPTRCHKPPHGTRAQRQSATAFTAGQPPGEITAAAGGWIQLGTRVVQSKPSMSSSRSNSPIISPVSSA